MVNFFLIELFECWLNQLYIVAMNNMNLEKKLDQVFLAECFDTEIGGIQTLRNVFTLFQQVFLDIKWYCIQEIGFILA